MEKTRKEIPAMSKRIVIVGGVAGGATAAAHARRLSEQSEIIVFERGPHVSFANCGLPYFIGGEIPDKEDLLVQTPESLRARFNLDVRVMSEVMSIDPVSQEVEIYNHETGKLYREKYDDLILSPGASPLKPPIPGIDQSGHFVVRSVPDVEALSAWIKEHSCQNAVVIGGGFIGLEMVEQLHRLGLHISLVEALSQVMSPLDPEMAAWLHQELRNHNVDLFFNNPVSHFDKPMPGKAKASVVHLKNGVSLNADLVILGLGVKPETSLAEKAGLEIGSRGGIRVDDRFQTSKPHIWAIGDAVEVKDFTTGEWTLIPLAGPANRQGRIVAENVFDANLSYAGTLGTSILRCFGVAAGCTGANEKTLSRASMEHQAIHLHPPAHASYYPEAERIALKILFHPESGKLLGAQAVGKDGVDKRIDVLATAIKAGMTVHDLEDLELAYAPPFGSAKDPVNLAGMVAQHVVHHDVGVAHWHEIDSLDYSQSYLLDVRDEDEFVDGAIPGANNIPLSELRDRKSELPRDKELVVYCQSGQRSYFACRYLSQEGFRVRNLSGAYLTWKMAKHCFD